MRYVVVVVVVVGIRQLFSFIVLFRHVFVLIFRECEIHSHNGINIS